MKLNTCPSILNRTTSVLQLGIVLLLLHSWGTPAASTGSESKQPSGRYRINRMPLVFQSDRPARSLSDKDLIEIATRYRAVSDAKTLFTSKQMARLREINPDIKILRYLNFATVYWDKAIRRVSKEHPDWILRDKQGKPVPSRFSGTGMMINPASEDWRDYLAQQAYKVLHEKGYDGIMADEVMMAGRLPRDFEGINPQTGEPYTSEQYRGNQYKTVRAVKDRIGPDKLLIANNVKRGSGYFQEKAYRFLEACDGVVAEGFRGLAEWPLDRYLDEREWVDNIEMLLDIQTRGKIIIAAVKFRTQAIGSESQLQQYDLFMYTTFLMGMGESSYYSSTASDPTGSPDHLRLHYDYREIDLGKPLSRYQKSGSHYEREFEEGRVIVNPTESPATVYLGGDFRTLEGETVSEVTLDAHTGTILLK